MTTPSPVKHDNGVGQAVVGQAGIGHVVDEGLGLRAIRWILLLLLWISPWYFGGATWSFQYILFFPAALLALVLGASVLTSSAFTASAFTGQGGRLVGRYPPWAAGVFLFLGVIAQVQSVRSWNLDAASSSSFPSIQLQRWALGMEALSPASCDISTVEPEHRKLALSVEPITTRGASSSLFLCGLLVWGASCVWGHRKAYPQFLLGLTVLGVSVGLYGLVGVFLRSKPNLLGLTYGSSFSVFVSKNSAGAFLNIALSAALGLAVWQGEKIYTSVARQMRSRDMRQWPWNAKFQYGLKTAFEKIDAASVMASLSVLLLAFCIAISLCRGAFVSAVVGVFVAVAIAWPGKKRTALLFGCFLAMVVAVVAMASLQFDQTALSRIESIERLDMETEKQSGRLYIWSVALRAAMHYGWLGSGLGTFHVAALPFQIPSSRGWYYHAESLFVEILVTMGYLGMLAALAALIATVGGLLKIYHSERFREYLPLKLAGAFFLASQALHASIDFAWILPGVYVPSALFIGCILGGMSESQRAYRRIHNQFDATRSKLSLRMHRLCSLSFALVCLLFLITNQRAVSVLALSEQMEKKFPAEDFPGSNKNGGIESKPMVDRWVDACADAYANQRIDVVTQSPILLRLLADGIAYDTRVERWQKRPESSSSELAWNQTRPVVIRLALESANQSESQEVRANIIEALGGTITMDRFAKANYWYTRAQLLSPLDWRLVWGRISTAMQCTPEQLKPLVPVLAKISAHRPANLTSGSLIYHAVLSDQEKLDLWQRALRANRAESIPIAEIMAGTYKDGQIPIETFPLDPGVLRKIYNEIFTAKAFPTTHEQLADKLIQASTQSPWTGLRKATWMADVSRETGKVDLEIENLTIILGLDRSNVPLLKRIVTLLIETKQKDKARGFLRQLVRAAPSDPSIESFNQQLDGMEP